MLPLAKRPLPAIEADITRLWPECLLRLMTAISATLYRSSGSGPEADDRASVLARLYRLSSLANEVTPTFL